MKGQLQWMMVVGACLLGTGCGEAVEPVAVDPSPSDGVNAAGDTGAASNSTSESTTPDASAADVSLEIKSWDEVQEWVAGQKGKVVVIDVWSTQCLECVREFPHFVELHESSGDEVACASVSIDYYGGAGTSPEDVRPAVEKFLTSKQATMANFLSSDTDEAVLQRIGVASIPAALVYDRSGKLHTTFKNDDGEYGPTGFNYADHIVPLVEQLSDSGT